MLRLRGVAYVAYGAARGALAGPLRACRRQAGTLRSAWRADGAVRGTLPTVADVLVGGDVVIIHVAGFGMQYEHVVRQRCAWCGVVMVDLDLAIAPCIIERDGSVHSAERAWPVGSLVASSADGEESWLHWPSVAQSPSLLCVYLDS